MAYSESSVVEHFDQRIAELSLPFQSSTARWQPMDREWARSAVEQFMEAQFTILLPDEHMELDRLVIQSLGAEA